MWAIVGLGLAAAGCGSSGAPTATRAADTTGAAAVKGGQAPTPVFATTVRLAPVSGTVLIRIPGARDFIELRSAQTVPIGTVIDTRAGTVRLTSATAAPTKLQTGNFFLGRFQVVQQRSLKGLTDLVIQDKLKRSVCSALWAASPGSEAQRSHPRPPAGQGKGAFPDQGSLRRGDRARNRMGGTRPLRRYPDRGHTGRGRSPRLHASQDGDRQDRTDVPRQGRLAGSERADRCRARHSRS